MLRVSLGLVRLSWLIEFIHLFVTSFKVWFCASPFSGLRRGNGVGYISQPFSNGRKIHLGKRITALRSSGTAAAVVPPEPPPESAGVEEAAFLPESKDDTKGSVILWAPFDI